MIEGVTEIVKRRMAEGATAEEIVKELYNGGAINDRTARFHVVSCEFFRIMGSEKRTARDTEQELSARFDIALTMVRYIRTQYVRGGRHLKRGASKKGN